MNMKAGWEGLTVALWMLLIAWIVVALDSSEKIVVNCQKGGSEQSLDVTRLGAFVKDAQSSQTVEEVKVRCRSLLAIR